MYIKIQSIHFDINQELESFINSKLDKLISRNESIIQANVILKLDRAQSEDNKIVEIKLEVTGKDLFAKKQSNSFEESTDKSIDALNKQLKKIKGKK
jgi:putative sigma-54 modulation protein